LLTIATAGSGSNTEFKEIGAFVLFCCDRLAVMTAFLQSNFLVLAKKGILALD
jgi:hypothetical protein